MPEATRDPTARFSDRVADYIRFRPGYPDELVATLQREGGVGRDAVVADVGSGTGISTELFLRNGYEVYAVEPNREMREAAERWLGVDPHFHSVEGRAEATTLPSGSVDLVVAGQAFHWFDQERAREEFRRLLRSGDGLVALFWNSRRTDTPFLTAYEELLFEYAIDYRQVNHRNIGPELLASFFRGEYETRRFPTEQPFDLAGLRGRLLSSSYAPAPGHPLHAPMLARLEEIFGAHQAGGRVHFLYDTELFYGPLG